MPSVLAALLAILAVTVGPALKLATFATGSTELTYEVDGTGPPVILLAGGPGMNPAYVVPVAHLLAADGRRVILLHQRGTGQSAPAGSCTSCMNVSGAVADLEALRLHLGLQRLTLAGHSWGGMLAMAYAQTHPDRVAGLLLLDTGPMDSAEFAREDAAIHAALTPAESSKLDKAMRDKDSAGIGALETKASFADPRNSNRLRESVPAGEPLDYPAIIEVMSRDLDAWDVRNGMRSLSAPITLIFGRRDPGFFVAAQIQKLQPDARLIVIENAGHYPWLENLSATTSALRLSATSLP
jgi:proline iminopeptidase